MKKQAPLFQYTPAAENRGSSAAESPSPQSHNEEAARERVQAEEGVELQHSLVASPVSSMSNMWSSGSPKSLHQRLERGTCGPFS